MRAILGSLQSCQRSIPKRGAPVTRWRPRPFPAFREHGILYRYEHDNRGPHKEYFQVPGQEPKPDLTPYIRDSQYQQRSAPPSHLSSHSTEHSQGQAQPDAESQGAPKGWLRVPRLIRSMFWFLLFTQLGVAAGVALITWDYLQPNYEPGSVEEQELIEDMLEMLESHPIIQDLRENKWVEVDAFTPDLQQGLKGRNLVHQVLGGNNPLGVFLKVFHHPSQEYTMLVFLPGFGVEGWPDVMHGGAIATLLQESLSKHITYYYRDYYTTPDIRTSIDYQQPCKPGQVYGVLVTPSGRKAATAGNVHCTELSVTSLLVQLPGAPIVGTEFNVATNVETHTVMMPMRKGQQPTHAVCQAVVKLIPKEIQAGGKAIEIGGKDDEGFAKALDFLARRPEFRGNRPSSDGTTANEQEKEP